MVAVLVVERDAVEILTLLMEVNIDIGNQNIATKQNKAEKKNP